MSSFLSSFKYELFDCHTKQPAISVIGIMSLEPGGVARTDSPASSDGSLTRLRLRANDDGLWSSLRLNREITKN